MYCLLREHPLPDLLEEFHNLGSIFNEDTDLRSVFIKIQISMVNFRVDTVFFTVTVFDVVRFILMGGEGLDF